MAEDEDDNEVYTLIRNATGAFPIFCKNQLPYIMPDMKISSTYRKT